jgi:signal transduction histidine kinase
MDPFRSIRSRLTATFLAIILAVMLITGLFLYNFLQRYFLNSLQDSLIRSGNSAADFVAGHLREQAEEVPLSRLAENFSRQSRARVIFIDLQGKVIGDSVRIGGLLGQVLDRAEVAEALEGRVGSSTQYSEATGQRVMQVAVPVKGEGGDLVGAVFLSAPAGEEIEQILAPLRRFLLTATLIAAAVVGGASVVLARRFTGPLEVLAAAAGHMGEGKLDQQIKVSSRDEIGHLAAQFNSMALRLNFYTSNLRNFAANVSHELRTPLASSSLLVKSMKEYEMEPEQRQEFLADLDCELDRLIDLVHDLLELTRLEEGEVQREKFNLDAMLRVVAEQVAPRFERQGLRLIGDFPAGRAPVYGSALQLRQAVHNLLDNALKYTAPGGWVKISLWFAKEKVGVKIEDTGHGIPAKDLPHIFERFYRVDQARSRDIGGTGLGLAIVRETINAHGGRIWAESKQGEGSAFYFTLPLDRD